MFTFMKRTARKVAPGMVTNVRTLATLDKTFDQGPARFLQYEKELRALRREVDELRRDNRRVAELYDAVFEWARTQPAAAAAAAEAGTKADTAATLERVGSELVTSDDRDE